MEKLLTWIKGLFTPRQAVAPPPEVEATPAPPAAPIEVAEVAEVAEVEEATPLLLVIVEEPPPAEPEREPEPAPALAEDAPIDLEPAPAEGLTLRLESERGSASTFQVTKSGATIGRGPESTIQLADLSVSRKHARIAYKQGAYWLSDVGSMGGTWVDGAKLAAPRRVAAGQTIDIGVCRLVVVAAAEGEKTGAAKGPSNAA
ncbi:MAG TPA: FHA domain-containing protein [Candidatus Limnocylindria bacterium]